MHGIQAELRYISVGKVCCLQINMEIQQMYSEYLHYLRATLVENPNPLQNTKQKLLQK